MHLSAFAWLHGMDQWMMDHLLETRKERCMCRAAAHRARRVAEPSDVRSFAHRARCVAEPSDVRSFVSNLPLHPSVRPSTIFLQVSAAPRSALLSAARPRLGLRAAAALALFIARSKRKADPMPMRCSHTSCIVSTGPRLMMIDHLFTPR